MSHVPLNPFISLILTAFPDPFLAQKIHGGTTTPVHLSLFWRRRNLLCPPLYILTAAQPPLSTSRYSCSCATKEHKVLAYSIPHSNHPPYSSFQLFQNKNCNGLDMDTENKMFG
jgi:hypothetical protein